MRKKARIYLRATSEEKREFKRRAQADGMTLSEWLMKLALSEIAVENKDE